jgi:hypothetical protein
MLQNRRFVLVAEPGEVNMRVQGFISSPTIEVRLTEFKARLTPQAWASLSPAVRQEVCLILSTWPAADPPKDDHP